MTAYQIAALYIAFNLVIAFLLALNVGKSRLKHKVSIGDGGNEDVTRVMRAHANFVEYAAIMLPALLAMAAVGTSAAALHLVGVVFTLARLSHYAGMGLEIFPKGRQIGTVMTILSIAIAAALLIMGAL